MIKNGFTLIEIIIVVVILGILATLALPRIFGQIDTAEAGEAMHIFGTIKRLALECYDVAGGEGIASFNYCDSQGKLNFIISAGSKFSYYSANNAVSLLITARATRNPANYISMTLDGTGLTLFSTSGPESPFYGVVQQTKTTFNPMTAATPF